MRFKFDWKTYLSGYGIIYTIAVAAMLPFALLFAAGMAIYELTDYQLMFSRELVSGLSPLFVISIVGVPLCLSAMAGHRRLLKMSDLAFHNDTVDFMWTTAVDWRMKEVKQYEIMNITGVKETRRWLTLTGDAETKTYTQEEIQKEEFAKQTEVKIPKAFWAMDLIRPASVSVKADASEPQSKDTAPKEPSSSEE